MTTPDRPQASVKDRRAKVACRVEWVGQGNCFREFLRDFPAADVHPVAASYPWRFESQASRLNPFPLSTRRRSASMFELDPQAGPSGLSVRQFRLTLSDQSVRELDSRLR